MNNRKLIGVIIPFPEGLYQQRVLQGLTSQAEKYGYDLAVFSCLVEVSHYHKDYLAGDMNIFNLIDYDTLDAVVLVPLPLVHDNNYTELERFRERLATKCKKPVVTLDLPVSDYTCSKTDDTTAFAEITKHILDVHKCSDIYFLAGTKDYDISHKRISGFTSELERRGLPIDESKIFYGDFWYTSGAALADKIISGELKIPDAIICASDHMAIGLANRLIEGGVKIPEDIIVTGFDATQEALLNGLSITTYAPPIKRTAQEAINEIRKIIEPDREISPPDKISSQNLVIGESCGCHYNVSSFKNQLIHSVYTMNHDYSQKDIFDKADFGRLMESYMFEQLTSTGSPQECTNQIFRYTYLVRPFDHLFICLRDNWLDKDTPLIEGYPEQMRLVLDAIPENHTLHHLAASYSLNDKAQLFDTKLMLPQIKSCSHEPSVFYFMPLHFQNDTLGYCVLQCNYGVKSYPTNVHRNWIRNVNNTLEMSRMLQKLFVLSSKDFLTGLDNRTGMENSLKKMVKHSCTDDNCFACVIDMDGLKVINDTFGHNEGDNAIITMANIINLSKKENEIAVRAGGDEIYLIGIGKYSDDDVEHRIELIKTMLDNYNDNSQKPYIVSASLGGCCMKIESVADIETAIKIADKNMYQSKILNKRHRI